MEYFTREGKLMESEVEAGQRTFPSGGAQQKCALAGLFSMNEAAVSAMGNRRFLRQGPWSDSFGVGVILDVFSTVKSSCCFARFPAGSARVVTLQLAGCYEVRSCRSGGLLVIPDDTTRSTYWIPQMPMVRSLDGDGHILAQANAGLRDVRAGSDEFSVGVEVPHGCVLDLVVWRVPAAEKAVVTELDEPLVLETQPLFMWSSHTEYRCLADVYKHLIFGHVYENHAVWPRYWWICSELDAHALFVALGGLERATDKRLYTLIRQQLVMSVIARQADDGGWYQGEWTDGMEAHYRLHGAAMQMLAAALEEWPGDDAVSSALEEAAKYIVERSASIAAGTWFLHDSLEESLESMSLYPFRWVSSKAFGKTPHNMLVLNTHLDTMIALDRYRRVTGDTRFDDELDSARAATRAVLGSRRAEWFYRLLFLAVNLTFLPKERAERLPFFVRAVKRIGWKYIIPKLPWVKAALPRLVMPGGHIERALSQCSWSDEYESVTLMDLVRYKRRFGAEDLADVVEQALVFTQNSGIRERWKESIEKGHALVFWVDALYQLCLEYPERRYRRWLAEAIRDVEDRGLGLSPSLLGGNTEAVDKSRQIPCPSPSDPGLRVVNLGRGASVELLVVNPTSDDIALVWQSEPGADVVWTLNGKVDQGETSPEVPARGWLLGEGKRDAIDPQQHVSSLG